MLLCLAFPVNAELKAFPEAQGFGAYAKGGRGGAIMFVTNLNDTGSGSLRACVEASGPRICVFRIGGTIELKSSLDIRNPFVTIAGQTAPGGGITLKTAPTNNKGLIVIRDTAHDTIMRYIRSRPGAGGPDGDTLDAITINTSDVILDHISASWGVDETVNTWYPTAERITVQWSIISEGLSNSIHPQGEHSKGFLMGDYNKNISVHHTLFAHNMDRHPEIKGDPAGVIEAVNNVVYNYGWRSILVSDNNGKARVNIIGNYIKPGPDSPSIYEITYYNSIGAGVSMFIRGNVGPHRQQDSNGSFTRSNGGEWSVVSPGTADTNLVTTAFPTSQAAVTIEPALSAYSRVTADAGNSKALLCDGTMQLRRDAVDTRIVNDTLQGTGHIIDSPAEVGGWPVLAGGNACPDTDSDGMSDTWEQQMFQSLSRGSNVQSTSDYDSDGYTDVEEFLNGSDPTHNGGSVSPTPGNCNRKLKGDADCNDIINLVDFEIFRNEYMSADSSVKADFNGDNKINLTDFEIWRVNYLG